MKIIIILATGALITFTADHRTNPDCFSKGYEILEKIATYHGPEEKDINFKIIPTEVREIQLVDHLRKLQSENDDSTGEQFIDSWEENEGRKVDEPKGNRSSD